MSVTEGRRNRLSVISLVYMREMRDQLRDRRTLFTIVVLPLVLYPLLGSLMLQVAQFSTEQEATICLVGAENLPASPPLLVPDGGGLVEEYIRDQGPMQVVVQPADPEWSDEEVLARAESWVRTGVFHAAVLIDPVTDGDAEVAVRVVHNAVSDASRTAHGRVVQLFARWRTDRVMERMEAQGVDAALLTPVDFESVDVAEQAAADASFWSKMLPFVMLVWALTGAFYPAIDLVAGEKERGTLETLLCSPALRSEIVIGKMTAVGTFSVMTAVLNVVSMLITSVFASGQVASAGFMAAIEPPPLGPLLWLLLALVPLSALFSALALAVASLARSSKEGQYYLMPLMMLALPLVMLPMMPGTELNAGNSLLPVSGMFLLVRALMEGQYFAALTHLPLVAGVTAVCLYLATRWAGRQFEDESVLFRGGEQWSMATWMRHLWRDRHDVATVGQAFGAAAIILVGLFFAKLVVHSSPQSFADLARLLIAPQLGLILAPVLLMACVLTRSLRSSLNFNRPPRWSIPMAVLLGVCLHPSYAALGELIQAIYPLSPQTVAALTPFETLVNGAPFLSVVLVMAVIPAVCEEVAFRGFIFNGLKRNDAGMRAVLVTAVLFGFSHGVLQQSLAATVMGVLLGWITWRSGTLLPALVVHVINNTLSVSLGRVDQVNADWVRFFFDLTGESPQYAPLWTLISAGLAISSLIYFSAVQPPRQDEETEPELAAGKLAAAAV